MRSREPDEQGVTLFLCGDVMTGRGIDQILPTPGGTTLHEPFIVDARDYVGLAEQVNGSLPRHVDYAYPWGDALAVLERVAPHARIINLETAITVSADYWDKGINYRMHPRNIPSITSAKIDCCVLANNHVLDWGYAGLKETLQTLQHAGIATSGAGASLDSAVSPAIIDRAATRILVFAFADENSGVPQDWAATANRPGINLLPDFTRATVQGISRLVKEWKHAGDIAIASIHWGGNWGYPIPPGHRSFAHALIDEAGIDLVHGHSSHHAKGFEVYQGKLVLYGCGDFLNDYEGIGGYEFYRSDLSLMYFPRLDPADGHLESLSMVPMQIRRFRLNHTIRQDVDWLAEMLNREGRALGTEVIVIDEHTLEWRKAK